MPKMNDSVNILSNKKQSVTVIYILYLASYFTGGLAALVGVIWAYVIKNDCSGIERQHIDGLIKLFWINLISIIVIVISWVFVIGIVLSIVWVIWSLYVTIRGLIRINNNKSPK